MPTAKKAAKTEPADEPDLRIVYAQTDDDVIAIHRFLLVVAAQAGAMRAPVDAADSINEIWRVVNHELALMALTQDNTMVGTMGIIRAKWWYSKSHFLTDRWLFSLDFVRNMGVGDVMVDEAARVAASSDLPLIVNGKIRTRTKDGRAIGYTTPRIVERLREPLKEH